MSEIIPHSRFGCMNCGAFRYSQQEISNRNLTSRNIYIKNDIRGDVVVGLCKDCFALESLDLDAMKTRLIEQEQKFLEESGGSLELLEPLRQMTFESYKKTGDKEIYNKAESQ